MKNIHLEAFHYLKKKGNIMESLTLDSLLLERVFSCTEESNSSFELNEIIYSSFIKAIKRYENPSFGTGEHHISVYTNKRKDGYFEINHELGYTNLITVIVFLQALKDTTKDIDVQKKIDVYLLKINNQLKLNEKGPFSTKDAKVFINIQNENISELDKKSKIYAMYSLYTCKLAILDIADNTILEILNKFSYLNMYDELDCTEVYSA